MQKRIVKAHQLGADVVDGLSGPSYTPGKTYQWCHHLLGQHRGTSSLDLPSHSWRQGRRNHLSTCLGLPGRHQTLGGGPTLTGPGCRCTTSVHLSLLCPVANFPGIKHLVGRTVRILPKRTGELLLGTYSPPVTLTLSPTWNLPALPPRPAAALPSTLTGLVTALRVLLRLGAILTPASCDLSCLMTLSYTGEGLGFFALSSFFFKSADVGW